MNELIVPYPNVWYGALCNQCWARVDSVFPRKRWVDVETIDGWQGRTTPDHWKDKVLCDGCANGEPNARPNLPSGRIGTAKSEGGSKRAVEIEYHDQMCRASTRLSNGWYETSEYPRGTNTSVLLAELSEKLPKNWSISEY